MPVTPYSVALVALVVALLALAVALLAYRRADDGAVRTPQPDRRQLNLGPPRVTGERRRGHRAPDEARARRRDRDEPQWTTGPGRPVGEGRDLDEPATGPVEAHPPTTDMRLPPPGAIGRPDPRRRGQ